MKKQKQTYKLETDEKQGNGKETSTISRSIL